MFNINDLILKPQERNGHYKFDSQLLMTRGFYYAFHVEAYFIVEAALKLIKDRVNSVGGADYIQIFILNDIKFYVIDNVDTTTFLLPNEY